MKVKVTGFMLALALALVLSPLIVTRANAFETIVRNPSDTAGIWTSPTNAFVSDDNYTTRQGALTSVQNYTDYKFGLKGSDTVLIVKLWFEWHTEGGVGYMRLKFVNSMGTWTTSSDFSPQASDEYDSWDVTSEQTWTPTLLDSLVIGVQGQKYGGGGGYDVFYVDHVYVEVSYQGGSAGGPPYGEGPTVPIQLPNIPWHLKQILQGILDFLSLRHVRVVLGCSFFFGVGLLLLKYEKRVKKFVH